MQIYVTREVVGERPVSEVIDAVWFDLKDGLLMFSRAGTESNNEYIPLARIYHIAVRY